MNRQRSPVTEGGEPYRNRQRSPVTEGGEP
jgi:hypothetical protein